MRQKILLILALLCAVVQGAWAQATWATVYTQTQTTAGDWTALEAGSTTGRTLGSAGNTTYYYVTSNLSFTNATAGGSGLTIQGTVYLYVPEGMTLTCTGANASGQTGAGAGIEVALGNSLYFLGSGTVNATGGNAANGGNGGNGYDAEVTYDESILGGSGGTGGNGGGGAGAGIGTRGGNGGSGGSGGQRNGSYGQETTQYGVDGNPGSAGSTAGAMGTLYVYLTLAPTVNLHGGNAGSNGTGGSRGLTASQHPGSNVYMASGGGGGGAGGFGGAASSIGTGGPGGGGGGGGAAGNVAWVVYSGTLNGYYHAGACGGAGGKNSDGSSAPNGADVELDNPKHADIEGGGLRPSASDYTDDAGWENGNGRHPGGAGGAAGSASVGGSYGTVTVDWTTQEDDWSLICLQTGTTRADWIHLTDGGTTGKTLGAAGTTKYYYTAADRTFSNSNDGGSGLTILGTVYLYIPSGKTITCTGINASGVTGAGGGAGIELTAGNTLYLIGSGKLVATGGNAANGGNGSKGGDATNNCTGAGGRGGNGGGGAGAGIGTRGGNGGAGGAGGASVSYTLNGTTIRLPGNIGNNGDNGGTAADMGTLYIYQIPALTTEIHGGSGGTSSDNGGAGGRHALFVTYRGDIPYLGTVGGGAGGAGGGFGGAASDIGTGGPGGGGGGGGASGSVQNYNNITYFLKVGAFGGAPGANVDGTFAGAGESTLMVDVNNLAQTNHVNLSNLKNGGWGQDGAGNELGDNRAAGGSGGTAGTASVSGSANAVTAGWPTQGKGIEDAPFIVSSTDDWNEFADYVNSGYAFSGNFVKLGDDISVSTMAGTSDANSFQGTFDGDGKTLTFTKGTSAEPFAEEYCAPFRHVKNAVIKNLHVDGTIYTNQKKAAGIVGESHGNLTITGCRSSISIVSSTVTGNDNHDGTHGGFVGTLSGENNTITIDGCVFDGSFATTNGTINCGGFIGWGVYNKPTIKNSLMKPGSVAAGMLNSTFARWYTGNEGIYEPTIDNCYYVATTNLPTDQGTEAAVLNITPANPDYDYGMVKAYKNGIWFDGNFYGTPATVTLADNADNSTTISSVNGCVADVTLQDRTLYKDGAWNTLCLPFNVGDPDADNGHYFDGTPLEGATVMTLGNSEACNTGFDSSTGTLSLEFLPANEIEAGVAYIVKWAKPDGYDANPSNFDITDPVFNGVTIVDEDPADHEIISRDGKVSFIGSYSPFSITGEDRSILFLGAASTLYYPNAAMQIGSCRAHFQLNGITAGDPNAGVKAFNLTFGDGEATGIISVHDSGFMVNGSDAWYTIDGRKLDGKPTQRGLYFNKGKKTVIN